MKDIKLKYFNKIEKKYFLIVLNSSMMKLQKLKGGLTIRIEENYIDATVYSTSFIVKGDRKIEKMLILRSTFEEIPIENIENLIFKTFKDVLCVVHIEEVFTDVLLLQQNKYYQLS